MHGEPCKKELNLLQFDAGGAKLSPVCASPAHSLSCAAGPCGAIQINVLRQTAQGCFVSAADCTSGEGNRRSGCILPKADFAVRSGDVRSSARPEFATGPGALIRNLDPLQHLAETSIPS